MGKESRTYSMCLLRLMDLHMWTIRDTQLVKMSGTWVFLPGNWEGCVPSGRAGVLVGRSARILLENTLRRQGSFRGSFSPEPIAQVMLIILGLGDGGGKYNSRSLWLCLLWLKQGLPHKGSIFGLSGLRKEVFPAKSGPFITTACSGF